MSIIRIKRSAVTGNPGTLAAGELAYSSLNGAGGNRLYIGMGSETGGNAANHFVIGGTYYTGLVDASTAGTLTTGASSIPILSATGTIDKWLPGNLSLTGDTIATTDTNGNLILTANGTGKISFYNVYNFPRTDGTANQVLATNGAGVLAWTSVGSASSATNIGLGTAGQIPYQTGPSTTSFFGPGTTGQILVSGGTGTPTYTNTSSIYVARAVLADTATTSTNAAVAFSLANTGTTYVSRAVLADSATTATNAAFAFSFNTSTLVATSVFAQTFNTSTLVANAVSASTATNAATAYSTVAALTAGTGLTGSTFNGSTALTWTLNTATLMATAVLAQSATTATSAATAYALANTATTFVGLAAVANTATSAATAYSWVGGTVPNPVTFSSPVTFSGTATYVYSTNTVYTDNILELHTTSTGVAGSWTFDDGKDIGFRFHYYGSGADQNAALVLADDSKYLEFYGAGAESTSGTFVGSAYGTIKTGNFYATGVMTATTFFGNLTGTASTANALANSSTYRVGYADTANTLLNTSTVRVGYTDTANNLAGGSSGSIPYQTGAGATSMLGIGSSGQVLQVSTVTGLAIWGDIDGGTY